MKAQPIWRRRPLRAGGAAHFLHDGLTDTLYLFLPIWAEVFGLSHSGVGLLKMTFSAAFGACQVPVGILAERWGERRLLAIGTVLAGLAFVAMTVVGNVWTLGLCALGVGIGTAVQHPLSSTIISRGFSASERRQALGIYNFIGDLGKVAVPAAVATVVGWAGWRAGAGVLGGTAMAGGVIIFIVLLRAQLGAPPQNTAHGKQAQPTGWQFRDRRGFQLLSAISVIDSAVRTGFLTFAPFLLIEKGAAVETIGFALALIFAGGAAGKLGCGLMAARIGIRRSVFMTEGLTAITIVALVASPLWAALAILPLLGAALNGTSSVLYGTVGDFVETERQSRAFGLFYAVGAAAGVVAPPAYGFVSDMTSVSVALLVMAVSLVVVIPLCQMMRPSLVAAGAEAP